MTGNADVHDYGSTFVFVRPAFEGLLT